MKLVKRLIELAFGMFLITLFAYNSDLAVQIRYYWPKEPITVRFFELVLFCVSLGIILAALGDFITQLKWIGERRRLLKKDKEHQGEVDSLTNRVKELEDENARLTRNVEGLQRKATELEAARAKEPVPEPVSLDKPAEGPTAG